jgi:electron transport complex protein RnfC
LPRDVGVLMMNVQSARALHQAVCNGRPLIDRVVTVDGDAVGAPGNYRVPLGTPISHLIDVCQIDLARAAVLLTGGPMMGQPTTPEHVITGGTGGLLALSDEERDNARTEPCLRCGVCMEVCPFNLPAIYLVENPQKAVLGCVECGACQFFCPAHQPLVAGLKQAKATVTAWD